MFSLQSLIRRLSLYPEERNKNTLTLEGTQAVFGLLRDQEYLGKKGRDIASKKQRNESSHNQAVGNWVLKA